MAAPKLFISYCWSSPEHEQSVIGLATQLRDSGVDVILDKWDLREGHDAVAFMEQMVTNRDVKKVAMICDQKYAEKADGRAGGVGTETQIISKKVYEKQAQEKFVAVVTEKDENGRPYLPTYYQSRIYIDLSEDDRYASNFEQLLRWVFDKPLYVKPELGAPPSFLCEGDHPTLGTSALFNRSVEAIKNQRPHAEGAFDEYCSSFSANLERFRLSKPAGEFDEAVVNSIEEFLPYRNEAIQLFITIARYSPSEGLMKGIHHLLESLIPYMHRPAIASSWREWDFDNFRFIVHELFLYALAVLLKHDRLAQAAVLLERCYYFPRNSEFGYDVMVPFTGFREPMTSLDHRNKRLKLRRLSLRSDLLIDRCNGSGIDTQHILQADFVAFLRAELGGKSGCWRWLPDTLLYVARQRGPFEIFARSASRAYYERAKSLLGIEGPTDLESLIKSYGDGSRRLPAWEMESFNPEALLGYQRLGTRA